MAVTFLEIRAYLFIKAGIGHVQLKLEHGVKIGIHGHCSQDLADLVETKSITQVF